MSTNAKKGQHKQCGQCVCLPTTTLAGCCEKLVFRIVWPCRRMAAAEAGSEGAGVGTCCCRTAHSANQAQSTQDLTGYKKLKTADPVRTFRRYGRVTGVWRGRFKLDTPKMCNGSEPASGSVSVTTPRETPVKPLNRLKTEPPDGWQHRCSWAC